MQLLYDLALVVIRCIRVVFGFNFSIAVDVCDGYAIVAEVVWCLSGLETWIWWTRGWSLAPAGIGYLLGEAKESQLFKDPVMLQRFQEINELDDTDKACVFTFLDAFLAKNKMQAFLK